MNIKARGEVLKLCIYEGDDPEARVTEFCEDNFIGEKNRVKLI